jgi:TolB protein
MSTVASALVRHAVIGVLASFTLSACSNNDSGGPDAGPGLQGKIAFVCEYDDGDNDELCLMNADGSDIRRLTDNPGPDRAPSWSPDGRYLAFNSRRPPHAGRPQIYYYDVEAETVSRISDGELEDHRPSWTPDGDDVVFQRGNFSAGFELFRQSRQASPAEQLTSNPGKINAAGSYSPDGSKLLLQSNRDADGLFPFSTYVVDVQTGVAERLAAEITASHDGPRWSPDGDRIAFAAGGNLYVIDVDTGAVSTVTDDEFYDSAPAWSPDGAMLVFQSDRLDAELTSIHVIDLESGDIELLGEGRTPVWSPAGF